VAASPGTDVVIIGAGCAGLSAGVRLASGGHRVTVIEEAPRLGGRAAAFSDAASGQRLDNGQHALFGCYRETYRFLRDIGSADLAPLDSTLRLTMADDRGRLSTLTCPAWRPPLHLIGGVMGWDAIPFADRMAAGRLGGVLWAMHRQGPEAVAARVSSSLTVTEWLRAHGQPASLCDWLWHPLALAALNQEPRTAAARPFVRVLGELFSAGPGAASLGVPAVPLDELYAEPAARFIEARGGSIRRRTRGQVELAPGGGRHRVHAGDDVFTPRAVIAAVPWHAVHRLWTGETASPLEAIADAAARMQGVPIVTVNLWFDRQVVPARQVGMVGTQFHWAFKKTNELVAELDDSRPIQLRAHLVTIVASGAETLLRKENAELVALAERELRACLPGAAGAVCVRGLVVREPRATFSLAPGTPSRPGTVTSVPGFFLAGDWTDTGLPGTIEGAVLSGHRAAEAAMIVL
jgi:squalene-associated FAD-dependent desaturase